MLHHSGLSSRLLRAGAGTWSAGYPITPSILDALKKAEPDVVVISGLEHIRSASRLVWCRLRRVPYVLLVESHDAGPKAGWRRTVKTTAVPPILRSAASVLVVGSLARESVVALGADRPASGSSRTRST